MSRSRSALLLAILLPLVLLSSACGREGSVPALLGRSDEASGTVRVPDVRGMTPGEACAALRDAGLEPVERLVHGPVEWGAGPMGEVYAQTPAEGSKATRGTKVTISSWWENE